MEHELRYGLYLARGFATEVETATRAGSEAGVPVGATWGVANAMVDEVTDRAAKVVVEDAAGSREIPG